MEGPVDLSKLTGALGGAMKIMAKEGNVNPSARGNAASSSDKEIPTAMYQSKSVMGTQKFKEEAIKKSGLPAEIMESFLNKQIVINQNGGAANDDAVAAEIAKQAGVTSEATQPVPKQAINENSLVGVSEEKIREIVREEMLKLFSGQVIKNITEQVVRKVKRK